MFKLVLSQNLTYDSKEEFINALIEYVEDACEEDNAPENYEDPDSWTDAVIHSFLDKVGGSFLYNQLPNDIEDWIDDSEKSGAVYQLVEE